MEFFPILFILIEKENGSRTPARNTLGRGGRSRRCRPWRDEPPPAPEGRRADPLRHRPAEAAGRTELWSAIRRSQAR